MQVNSYNLDAELNQSLTINNKILSSILYTIYFYLLYTLLLASKYLLYRLNHILKMSTLFYVIYLIPCLLQMRKLEESVLLVLLATQSSKIFYYHFFKISNQQLYYNSYQTHHEYYLTLQHTMLTKQLNSYF